MPNRGVQNGVEIPAAVDPLIPQLYQTSKAENYGLTQARFEEILREVAAKLLPDTSASPGNLWLSLKIEDLALARGCAAGHERAWEVFLTRYREKLYDIAGYITKESSAARDLADSTYADLYGLNVRQGQRVSKLSSYTGRGSLEGWLRTVMAQEFVNRYRRQRRLVSLEEESEEGAQFAAPTLQPVVSANPKLTAATDQALAELSPEDRFILASYYLDSRTLAEIARILHVHESTISRKVDKLTKSLRKRILVGLTRHGLSRRQAEEALEVDVRDLRVNLRASLVQETSQSTFSEKKAEASGGDP